MGIPGLTTYISNHSEHYLENYALHDTYLVIDGNSVACQLYFRHSRCDSAFGGDYDKYGQCVSNFFDDLSKCNVTSLVLIDGGCEDKKLKTIISRTKEKIGMASCYTFHSKDGSKFFPLLMKEVFKDVMNEKGVKYAHCIFEADNTIAAIARILNCPVLSFDSDFYIYGSSYIPFDTWENNIVYNSKIKGHMKYCKVYYPEKLFRVYKGLNKDLLPLAAILLGNDYVKRQTFKNFFSQLKLPPVGRRRYNEQQRRIAATFNWLRGLGLNQAVTGILSRLRRKERKSVLNLIETMINCYSNASLDVVQMLDIPAEKFSKSRLQNVSKTYKFEGDIYNLMYIEEKINETEPSDDDELNDKEIASILAEKEVISDESLINNLPQWFVNEFKLGRYPSYFIDIIIRKLYICPPQIEHYLFASSVVASLSIISVIYGLLVSGVEENKTCMEYMTRDKNTIKRFQLPHNDSVFGCKLPLLSNLRELPMIIRRGILDNTLRITDDRCISEIPPNWQLYIATMKYWIDQEHELPKLNCHVYSLLFAMLFNIVDQKVGFHRVLNKFRHRFDKLVQEIWSARKSRGRGAADQQPKHSDDITLVNALHEVNKNDCWIAASLFFVSNFETNSKLFSQPKKFDITIVHGFAEFQNCLRHSMHLNALLGYPYEQTKVASVFNGTLLYNVCSSFQKRQNIEEYINSVLQDSPSLLRLFNILLSKVQPLFGKVLEKEVRKRKIPKTRRSEKKMEEDITQKEYEETAETTGEGSEEVFHDVNNSFTILGAIQN